MDILKSIGAVLAGIVFVVASHSVTDLVVESLGIFPPPGTGYLVAWMAVAATIYRSIFTVVGGYITAALAPSRPMLHAMILGVFGAIAGAIAAVVTIPMDLAPAWYPVALAVLALPCTLLGGKLRSKKS
jgi:hypothetical protein